MSDPPPDLDDLSLPPTDGRIWPPNVMIARARVARSLAASAIVTGCADPLALESYRSWVMISTLLGDIDVETAAGSIGRAEQMYATNVADQAKIVPLNTPSGG